MSEPQQEEPRGPNLPLIYALIVLAFIAAIAIAGWIVAPFYLHRH